MRPLVAVRRAVEFDPCFARDALFWPLARALRALGPHDDFPSIESLAKVFDGDPPVRFVTPLARRRRGAPVDVHALYDARITVERVVPTRPRCWHDLMNALVWGTFPKAKLALHARQHRRIVERIGPDARSLPPRSRELDALALLDEGGVVVLARDPAGMHACLQTGGPGTLRDKVQSGAAEALVFGHAIYESLALGVKPVVVAAVTLMGEETATDVVRAADAALARALDDDMQFTSPRELTRVEASEATQEPRVSLQDAHMSHVSPCLAQNERSHATCEGYRET